MTSNSWWTSGLVIIFLRIFSMEAAHARASRKGDTIVFRAATGARALFAVVLPMLVILEVRAIGQEETWVIVLGSVLTLCASLGWPATITIDAACVARHIWWRRTLRLPWESVVILERDEAGDLTVCAADGRRIVFSGMHVDPGRFQAEVLKRAKLDRPTDWSAPATMGGLLRDPRAPSVQRKGPRKRRGPSGSPM
jgi:hypothetical protein